MPSARGRLQDARCKRRPCGGPRQGPPGGPPEASPLAPQGSRRAAGGIITECNQCDESEYYLSSLRYRSRSFFQMPKRINQQWVGTDTDEEDDDVMEVKGAEAPEDDGDLIAELRDLADALGELAERFRVLAVGLEGPSRPERSMQTSA